MGERQGFWPDGTFWNAYLDALSASRIRAEKGQWYVRAVERYCDRHRDTPLSGHGADQV